jgi:predicted site-specific integrase-resolvase
MAKRVARQGKKTGIRRPPRGEGFGQGGEALRAGLYARVSSAHQQTIPMQLRTLREYVARRRWKVTMTAQEVKSGAKQRPQREILLQAARRRELDVILVWRLDRWGRSLSDLVVTLKDEASAALDRWLNEQARISPLAHAHVIPSGTYRFEREAQRSGGASTGTTGAP